MTGKAQPARPKTQLDIATIAGLLVALAGIVGGLLLEGGKIADIAQITAAFIVLGGTAGAVLVTTPMAIVVQALAALRMVFFEPRHSNSETVKKIIHYAAAARRHGIVALEQEVDKEPDAFLRKALGLAVDGVDLSDICKTMELEISSEEHMGENTARVYEAAGGYSPTIGIIGAVLGLIQVMKNLDDIKEVGRGIAVAFVATVYGVALANLLLIPAAAKIKTRTHQLVRLHEMMLEGVVSIVQGMNPKLIRSKLEAFERESGALEDGKRAAPVQVTVPSEGGN